MATTSSAKAPVARQVAINAVLATTELLEIILIYLPRTAGSKAVHQFVVAEPTSISNVQKASQWGLSSIPFMTSN